MSRRILARTVLVAALSCLWASALRATEVTPTSPAPSGAPAAPAPAGAAVAAPLPSAAPQPAAAPQMRRGTAEERALVEVQERGRRQVAALVAATKPLPDGPARRALEKRVEDLKKQNRVDFLRVKARFARERGDLAAAREAEQRIELILNPPRPQTAVTSGREKAPHGAGSRP